MERAPNPWDRFYHQHAAPWRGERDLRPWQNVISGRVLELGCGNGKLLLPLERAGFETVGLDVSFHAMKRLGRGVLADAAVLPFRDGAFHTVFDIHCTGHLDAEGRLRAGKEKRRVLQAGGHLIVERLMPNDLRAAQGEETDESNRRVLQDGRSTHFSSLDDIVGEHPDFELVSSDTAIRSTKYGGEAQQRASIQAVFQAV